MENQTGDVVEKYLEFLMIYLKKQVYLYQKKLEKNNE
jgi:hypothetical protein